MGKRGQTTIFIIVAIVIVVAGILVFVFFPESTSFLRGELVADNYLKDLIEPELLENVERLSLQGGYDDPEGFVLYKGHKVKYVCYTAHYTVPCGQKGSVQQPFPKNQFERELTKIMQPRVEEWVDNLKEEYSRRGFAVSNVGEVSVDVKIVPDRIVTTVSAPMTVTKDSARTFSKFTIETPSKMYGLLLTATSIIDYEANLGDASTDLYLRYYPNLRMVKDTSNVDFGTTVYTLTDVTTDEKFVFASRSLVFDGGYGLE